MEAEDIKINEDISMKKDKLGELVSGYIHKGFSLSKNKQIAIKFIPKKVIHNMAWNQIKIMKLLSKQGHKNIIQYYGHEKKQQGTYLFFQFCSGDTLSNKILKEGPINQLKALEIFRELIQAMLYMSKLKLAHKDIKPSNIIFNDQQELKLINFDFAEQLSQNMQTSGTPIYMAPEILIKQSKYTEKCDVWSVGMVLYEMLTGKNYFMNKKIIKNINQLKQEIKKFNNDDSLSLIQYPQNLHEEWRKITSLMLTYDPTKRVSIVQISQIFKKVQQKMRQDIIKSQSQLKA